MSKASKFAAFAGLAIFILATATACVIAAIANPYSGANLALASIVSCPIYFLGVLASVRWLRCISSRSIVGWIGLGLNLLPFGFTAYLIGVGVTGHW